MSLFQFGVRRASDVSQDQPGQDHSLESVPTHRPNLEESGLGRVEFEHTLKSDVGNLADPTEAATKKRKARGKYLRYTAEQRANNQKICIGEWKRKGKAPFFVPFFLT